ncbi:HHAT [Bugula neritina]|uniref:HHAT n=1 Tax=Bugula neritina TaxID=10212 RepID=A0A7J7JII1_BUGNE|nr:HHAT [Bugula neritina]
MKGKEKEMYSVPEILISSILYLSLTSWCCYLVFLSSLEKEDMLSFDLHPSWWFGRKMDDSDYEWRYWADYYTSNILFYLGHMLMGLIFNLYLEKGRIYTNIVYSLASLTYLLGLKQLTFLICNVCVVYLCVLLTRRKAVVWAASLLLLALLNMQGTSSFIVSLCYPDPTGTRYMAFVYAMSICNLRLISLGVDVIDMFNKSNHIESFYRVISYALYFPTFFSGPFISYRSYISCVSVKQEPVDWSKVKWFLSESLLLISWWILMEILLHYFYSTALQQEEYFLISADNMTVFALCFVQAALFNLKYLVLYGVPTLFAQFDGIHMPPRPCCLLTQHKASTIWRTFDVGLYNFIMQYIYIPLGGSKLGLSQQVLTMFLCFIFIGFWHGAAANIFIWVLINFLAIFLENVHRELLHSKYWKHVLSHFGSGVASRLEAILLTPVGILSLWSMFVFLGGKNVGYNLYKKLLRNAHLEMRITLIVLAYCHMVFSKSLENGDLFQIFSHIFKSRHISHTNKNDIGKKSKHKHYS